MKKKRGIKATEFLSEVSPDQNLENLGQLVTNAVNGVRRWFRSAILQPILSTGYYDPNTGKYVLGPPEGVFIRTTSRVSTASVGLLTLTGVANRRYKVIMAQAANATDLDPQFSLTFTPVSGTGAVKGPIVNAVQGLRCVLLGGSAYDLAAGGTFNIWSHPITLIEGDTLTITADDFAAADDMDYEIIFEEWYVP